MTTRAGGGAIRRGLHGTPIPVHFDTLWGDDSGAEARAATGAAVREAIEGRPRPSALRGAHAPAEVAATKATAGAAWARATPGLLRSGAAALTAFEWCCVRWCLADAFLSTKRDVFLDLWMAVDRGVRVHPAGARLMAVEDARIDLERRREDLERRQQLFEGEVRALDAEGRAMDRAVDDTRRGDTDATEG